MTACGWEGLSGVTESFAVCGAGQGTLRSDLSAAIAAKGGAHESACDGKVVTDPQDWRRPGSTARETGKLFVITTPLVTAWIVAAPLPLTSGGDVEPASLVAEATKLLEKGDAAAALSKTIEALEYAPEDAGLLDLASRSAEAAARTDEALWYASLVARVAGESKEMKALLEKTNKRASALDPMKLAGQLVVDRFGDGLLNAARECQKRKLFANAADLLLLCERTSEAARARGDLERLYGNKAAVQALLDADLDVPVTRRVKRTASWLAATDAQHSDWKNAHQFKGDNYTIVTNMSYEMGETMSGAMEQMNRFYRKIFQVREGGGDTARVTIRVYRSRKEFEEYEKVEDENQKGYYSPSEYRVATYDPRTEGSPLSQLWSTLFHESSHQFTQMISTGTIPGWLDEGTASYFEGALLLGSGIVETNLLPERRLKLLHAVLEEGRPTLQEVVSYFQPESYPAKYYDVGWGLVYFLHNYEDENSDRVYVSCYREFLKSYKSGEKHDPFDRFVDWFIRKPKLSGVTSFKDFEARWKHWIQTLNDLQYGPANRAADLLIERARKQRRNGKFESARESYQWALRKRPGSVSSYLEMADVLVELKQTDAAILSLRRAYRLGQTTEATPTTGSREKEDASGAVANECVQRLSQLDRHIAEVASRGQATFVTDAVSTAQAYAANGFPRRGMSLIDVATDLVGEHRELREARAAIRRSSGADTRMWRRLRVTPSLEAWEAVGGWSALSQAVISNRETEGLSILLYRNAMPRSYRFETNVLSRASGKEALIGIVFGANEAGNMQALTIRMPSSVEIDRIAERSDSLETLETFDPKPKEKLQLAVEVNPPHVEFYFNRKSLGTRTYSPEDLRGGVGLYCYDAEVEFTDMRALY